MNKTLIFSNGEDVDLQLKSAIEGVVIKWVTQITEVLQETPSSVHKSLENPLPFAGKLSTFYPNRFLVSILYYISKTKPVLLKCSAAEKSICPQACTGPLCY